MVIYVYIIYVMNTIHKTCNGEISPSVSTQRHIIKLNLRWHFTIALDRGAKATGISDLIANEGNAAAAPPRTA